ncbi:MAG: efflux RND transporter periplasmic adaptor subunit [Eubacteriales bacterium]|nr:efflux RND transporter periplasmic adaptor subunit [Eubacteriales bacterium]
MATVRKTKKKKYILPICLVLVVAVIVTSVIVVKQNNSGEQVTLNTISTQDIVESINVSGEVSAGTSREYKVASVATVKEVFVKVGDKVKEGDTLVTFDTADLDAQVADMQTTYVTAKEAYNESVKSQKSAEQKLKHVDKQIPVLEKKLAKLKKATSSAATTTVANNTSLAKKSAGTASMSVRNADGDPDDDTTTTAGISIPSGDVQNSLAEISDALTGIMDTLTQLTEDIETMNTLLETITVTVSEQISNGVFSSDAIANACGDAIAIAIQKGLVDETKLIIDSGVAVDMIETAVRAVDWRGIAAGMENTDTAQQTAAELQLAALYAEREVLSVSADKSIVNSQRAVMNTSKKTLDVLLESQQTLGAGWKAAFDGVVTECNVADGEQTNLATIGLKVENMDAMVVNVSLGEYDVHKVKVGMPVSITTAYGQYTGKVETIAPTATGSSNNSIVDSVGTMAGVSGLSSLTDSGAGVKCTISVDEPDSNIIVGFNADVEIITGSFEGVTCVPIESIVREKDGTYVYLYNEEEGTVTKTAITTAATSDTAYQVTGGIKVGDRIVATPANDYEEDTFKVKVVEKSVAKAASTKK